MAKNQIFYKGKKKRKNYSIVPTIIILAVISAAVVLFYSMQKYVTITKDDVKVTLPFMEEENVAVDEQGNEVKTFENVTATITFNGPDYSSVEARAGKNSPPVRAIFVAAEDVCKDNLLAFADRLSTGNALMVEMKPRDGYLNWNSNSLLAYSYGLSGETDKTREVETTLATLKERGVYLVAQISCCIDKLLCASSANYSIKNSLGVNYTNDMGYWIDPYNDSVRQTIVEMVRELYALGFDEVVLADVMHPQLAEEETVYYTRELSTEQNSVNAVCSLAKYLADELEDRPGLLSIYCDSAPALVKSDVNTGQNAVFFMKLYDRVYYCTDKYAYSYNVEDIRPNVTIGKVNDRLVPVVENYLPENSSWVYIETMTWD